MNLAMQRPRVVIITRDGPEQRYVANTLCHGCDVAAIVMDVTPRASILNRARRYAPATALSKGLRAAYLWLIGDDQARRHATASVLGGAAERFARDDLIRPVPGLHASETREMIRRLQPDVIAVYGCSIVPDALLGEARVAALNMHTGIAPQYRGTHCAFWPIVNGEPHMLGATVHVCTGAVDHGSIIAKTRARAMPGDGLHELFARCVLTGAAAYVHAIEDVASGERGCMPESRGQTYRASDRGIIAELRARKRLRRGLAR